VLVVCGATPGVFAAKTAKSTIPIVFTVGSDPIRSGLVANLNPGSGNVAGVTFFSAELSPKRLELMRELVPSATSVAVLANPTNLPNVGTEIVDIGAAAAALGMAFQVVTASSESELEPAFAKLDRDRIGVLIIASESNRSSHWLRATAFRRSIFCVSSWTPAA
jgi:putative tryptophan/tyrosine transport system substrate-binding protein